MTAVKSQHSRIFEQLMAEYRQKLVDALITGTPSDQEMRGIIGSIRCVDDALRISEEADFKLNGDDS